MVFPGVTKAYQVLDHAKAVLQKTQDDGMIPVVFKFNGTAIDVSKFLADDPLSTKRGLPDGLLQRLTA